MISQTSVPNLVAPQRCESLDKSCDVSVLPFPSLQNGNNDRTAFLSSDSSTFVCESENMPQHLCEGLSSTSGVCPHLPSLRQGLQQFAATYPRLAGLQLSGHSPASTTHVTTGWDCTCMLPHPPYVAQEI